MARWRWARWRWGFILYIHLGRYVARVKLSLTPPRELALALARRGEPWRLGVEMHEHPACGGRQALHLHLGRCRSLVKCGWRLALQGEVVPEMKLEEMKKLSEKKLRELGLSLYEAWRCVEHLECPEGVDYGELYEAFWMYVDAVEALERRSIIAELEQRYMEETRAHKERVQAPA